MINSMVGVVSYTKGIFQDNEERAAGAKPVTTAVRDDTRRTRENGILCGLHSQNDDRKSKLILRGMSSKHLQVAARLSSATEKLTNS
jgi:hypothetical protein